MQMQIKVGIGLGALMAIFGSLYYFYWLPMPEQHTQSAANPKLQTAILSCEDITEKAAAHLVAVVDFQKLEIAGRKAHVFKQCMHDRGYQESDAWLKYRQAMLNHYASQHQISHDEALENLRRIDMMLAEGEKDRPKYWVERK